jgi:hypothetical protein
VGVRARKCAHLLKFVVLGRKQWLFEIQEYFAPNKKNLDNKNKGRDYYLTTKTCQKKHRLKKFHYLWTINQQ